MDMSSESSAARWYAPPRSLEPPSGAGGPAGVSEVVGNPDYRGYYGHAGPTTHHPAAAAHYAHSKSLSFFYLFISSSFFLSSFPALFAIKIRLFATNLPLGALSTVRD